MTGSGLLAVIEMLGNTITDLNAEIDRLRAANDQLATLLQRVNADTEKERRED